MMKKVITAGLVLACSVAIADERPADHMYPETIDGLVINTFILPTLDNEQDRLIEVLVSTTIETKDTCNNMNLPAAQQRHSLEGWGYSYYIVRADNGVISTMMGCDNEETVEREVFAPRGELLNYNSKIPLVIYSTENVTIDYRVWAPVE
ncbi:ecotin [Vibrio astriarenae]|uniref:Ecotin n=1 Tax=Vibrio astriarenae TaxID=1481923 RepID=A0A7Z2YFI2_9VIBR|nr:ecotin family protein [Vibrio astriarenae]QIA65508.1 ecotin [Vibrio astriarenae]